jgi:hypothetical protein
MDSTDRGGEPVLPATAFPLSVDRREGIADSMLHIDPSDSFPATKRVPSLDDERVAHILMDPVVAGRGNFLKRGLQLAGGSASPLGAASGPLVKKLKKLQICRAGSRYN